MPATREERGAPKHGRLVRLTSTLSCLFGGLKRLSEATVNRTIRYFSVEAAHHQNQSPIQDQTPVFGDEVWAHLVDSVVFMAAKPEHPLTSLDPDSL